LSCFCFCFCLVLALPLYGASSAAAEPAGKTP
jgi:hypothetical protein